MPEYLAPGVFVEEVSFRAKSIEGVPTSTTGFVGATRFGPVVWGQPGDRPRSTAPRLVTSFTEFERVYGGLEALAFADAGEQPSYLAHAARAFFLNGGKRLYIARAYRPAGGPGNAAGVAEAPVPFGTARWQARWPGEAGEVLVDVRATRSRNVAFVHPDHGVQARLAGAGSLVEVTAAGTAQPAANAPLDANTLRVVTVDTDGRQTFVGGAAPGAADTIAIVDLTVTVTVDADRVDAYTGLGAHPSHRRFIGRILQLDDPEDEDAVVWCDVDPAAISGASTAQAAAFAVALTGTARLTGGTDGDKPQPDDLAGREADPDDAGIPATGLEALDDVDDIAIIAAPDGSTYADADTCAQAADRLIGAAERNRFRVAIVDGPAGSSMNEIRAFRGRFDSKYAALYHPWIEILDPLGRVEAGAPPARMVLPPSGFVAGIWARSDIERGVHKAPANEVVRGLTQFEANVNTARNEVLNPEGINALRFFEGRGNRVWGARTLSSDPEWRYVNVRRLFVYIEHSIYDATHWAVFEPNNARLWQNVRIMVEDFLLALWRDGALLGAKPEEAYFVRCDRTTMTQNDLDNGRLICLVGVAPTKPAEFVIFRIGQWTADARMA
ncbi:MAG TPA: phage tail sheath subtilisin-like domain-containing protein [Acidimicrobiales bacterium]